MTSSYSFRFIDDDARRISVVTPEGVPLVFTLAGAGDRAAAFLTDAAGIIAVTLLVTLLGFAANALGGGNWLTAFIMLAVFLIRNLWFIVFEHGVQGSTPGKRAIGIRVIDRNGGPLRSEAVFARNLTREVEVFVPLIALLAPETIVGTHAGWLYALSVLWMLAFAFFPLLNANRLRVGDLIAGTIVVKAKPGELRSDLSTRSQVPQTVLDRYKFTQQQLDQYGVFELQVLEDLLRNGNADPKALQVVAEKIQRKIAWSDESGSVDSRGFLSAFYRAQRNRLEKGLLLGKTRERKRSGKL